MSHPGKVLAIMAIVIMGSPIVAMALLLAFRYPPTTAGVVGASLAQIGDSLSSWSCWAPRSACCLPRLRASS